MKLKFFIAFILFLLPSAAAVAAPIIPLSLKNSRVHNSACYTQGLFIHDGHLYESSGLYSKSMLAKLAFQAGTSMEVVRRHKLGDKYFAEGAACAEGEIYLLTWREETGFVLDPGTLLVKRKFFYSGEGWGLAWDGRRLWRSDGSAFLYPHSPGDFALIGEPLAVHDEGKEVPYLNELEWDPATNLMLANVYGSDLVAAIDLDSGAVRFWLDARPLRQLARGDGLLENPGRLLDTVLNGLALDGDSLWLTGKLWPRLYQVDWPPEAIKPPTKQK